VSYNTLSKRCYTQKNLSIRAESNESLARRSVSGPQTPKLGDRKKMDPANTFDTDTTYRAMRAEYAILGAVSGYLLWRQRKQVRWPAAVALFAWSDTVGYIPGAIAYRRSHNKQISKGYYAAYNFAHSGVTAATLAAVWARLIRPEWALLGIPFHIGVDRSVFGNFLKPFSVPFEPERHPAWAKVREELSTPWSGRADPDADGGVNNGGSGSPRKKSGHVA
jgi:hypothetical protein